MEHRYVWDKENYLLETDSNDLVLAMFSNEPEVYGRLISQHRNSVTSYYHYDALGYTRALTIPGENITDTYLYNAWGELVSSTGTTPNPFLYVGQLGYFHDPETDTYYIRARTYQPTIARWWSVDPSLFIDGSHVFTYVLNSPVLEVDPTGHQRQNNDLPALPGNCDVKCGGQSVGEILVPCVFFTRGQQAPAQRIATGAMGWGIAIYFRPNDMIPKRCECKGWGFVQVVRTNWESKKNKSPFIDAPMQNTKAPYYSNNDGVFHGLPECKQPATVKAKLLDRPSRSGNLVGRLLKPWPNKDFFWEAEACVVCKSSKPEVFYESGCVTWGASAKWVGPPKLFEELVLTPPSCSMKISDVFKSTLTISPKVRYDENVDWVVR